MKKVAHNGGQKTVWWLGTASLLNDISSEMILPILPMIITQAGGSGFAIGVIGGLRNSAAEILKLLFGWLSDRLHNRKFFIYSGYIFSAVFKLLLAVARSWYQIFALIGLERVGKALRTAPRDALISQAAPTHVGHSFGIHRMLDTLGALTGSLVAFFLVWWFSFSYHSIIIIAAMIAFLSVLPLPHAFTLLKPQQTAIQKSDGKALTRSCCFFLVIVSFFGCAHISYMFFMLKAQEIIANHSPLIPMLLYTIFNIFYTICAIPLGLLSDRFGRWGMLVAGYALFAVMMFRFCYVQTTTELVGLFIMYGVALALIQINHKALVADLAPAELKATLLGLFETIIGIVVLFGGVIAGILWETMGHSATFAVAGISATIACVLMLGSKRIFAKK